MRRLRLKDVKRGHATDGLGDPRIRARRADGIGTLRARGRGNDPIYLINTTMYASPGTSPAAAHRRQKFHPRDLSHHTPLTCFFFWPEISWGSGGKAPARSPRGETDTEPPVQRRKPGDPGKRHKKF